MSPVSSQFTETAQATFLGGGTQILWPYFPAWIFQSSLPNCSLVSCMAHTFQAHLAKDTYAQTTLLSSFCHAR